MKNLFSSPSRGVTYLEILFVITIIGMLSILGLWYFTRANTAEALKKDAQGLTAILSEARSLSLSSKNAVKYGVHLEEFQAVLFQGTSYNSSDTNNRYQPFNRAVHMLSHSLNGGGDEILFSRLTGETDNYGSVTLSLINNSLSSTTITISSAGVIQ